MICKEKIESWLIWLVCISAMMSFFGFALWPVFLVKLGLVWNLSNTEIGWVSGAYFAGYVVATPFLVGLTDRIDSKIIFIAGCLLGIIGNLAFIMFARDFLSALITWTLVGCGLAGTYMPGLQILNAI